jgi:hypothetical protein
LVTKIVPQGSAWRVLVQDDVDNMMALIDQEENEDGDQQEAQDVVHSPPLSDSEDEEAIPDKSTHSVSCYSLSLLTC